MSEFERFRKWAKAKGHYQTVDAINRYLNIPEEDRERAIHTRQDLIEIESGGTPTNKSNNS